MIDGDKLDTGMKVAEAIERTRKWWEASGRALILDHKSDQIRKQGASFSSADPGDSNYIPSGIMNGLAWDALTKEEKLNLVKAWHHFNVRLPDVIGSPEHQYKFGNRHEIQ